MKNNDLAVENDLILVIDSEKKAARAIQIIVETDFSVISAFNLDDAIQSLKSEPERVKLAFINSNIGEYDWELLLLKITTDYPKIKTILVSENEEFQQQALNIGVDGIYKKPIIDTEGIQREIDRVMETA